MNTPAALAHAAHLKSLIELGRARIRNGEKIPEHLWKRMDEVAEQMGVAMGNRP